LLFLIKKNFSIKIIILRFKKNNKSFISKDGENNKTGLLSTNLNNEKNDENINNHIKHSYETDNKNREIINAIDNLEKQIIHFFEKNPNHLKFLRNTSFHDLNNINDRFCRFCLHTKVLILF